MTRRPNPQVIPPDGWHYLQAHHDKQKKVEGDTLSDLYVKVLEFRIANGIFAGPVQQDVDEQLCSRFPRFCHTLGTFTPTVATNAPHPSATNRWVDRVLNWLNAQRLQPASLVDSTEAKDRMKACQRCKYNQTMSSGCDKCDANVRELAYFVRQGRKLPNEDSLECCKLLNIDNKAAVWMPKDRITVEANLNLPSICPYR